MPSKRLAIIIAATVALGFAVAYLTTLAFENSTSYVVQGDTVYVNNETCAMSGSPIAHKDMGRFESRIVYEGPLEQFRGKTLVFNQCCNACIQNFPAKWAKERDELMKKFGLSKEDS